MDKLEHTPKQKKGKRVLFRTLVAAAILAMLPVTAYAAEEIFGAGDWFRGRMNDQLKEDQQYAAENDLNLTVQETVSQGQVDVANELGQNFVEQTITSNGTTMTMTAAYGDEYVLHVFLQVQTPEGTALPDDCIYKFYTPDDVDYDGEKGWRPLAAGEEAPYDDIQAQITNITPLPDSDPKDNHKDFDITLTKQYLPERIAELDGLENVAKFNDGVSKLLSFTGIYQQIADVDGDEDGYIPFATGDFTFDVGLINNAEVICVDVAGKDYGGHVVNRWKHPEDVEGHFDWCPPYDENGVHTEEWDYTVSPISLKLTALSAQFENDFTCSDERRGYGLEYKIVMKDGTSPMKKMAGGFGGTGEGYYSELQVFSTPIDLAQIDYIEIGDPDVCVPYKIDMY